MDFILPISIERHQSDNTSIFELLLLHKSTEPPKIDFYSVRQDFEQSNYILFIFVWIRKVIQIEKMLNL